MLDTLRIEEFAGRIGERFAIALAEGGLLELELVEARGLSGDTPEDSQRSPFSLLLRALEKSEGHLPQGTYELAHPELGALTLFLVPIGPDREGRMRYEVVFS